MHSQREDQGGDGQERQLHIWERECNREQSIIEFTKGRPRGPVHDL